MNLEQGGAALFGRAQHRVGDVANKMWSGIDGRPSGMI
jgi:hypothetical protein